MSSVLGFYKQKKTTTTTTNTKSSKSSKKPPVHNAAQSPALTDVQDDYSEGEAKLREFDMNMAYGPCAGMTRLARWERAQKLGLNPPIEIENLVKSGKVQAESLWDGRI